MTSKGLVCVTRPVEWSAMSTRILIVEDDRDIADLVAHYLGKAGFTTDVISAGRDALKAIVDRPPDLVVLDQDLHVRQVYLAGQPWH